MGDSAVAVAHSADLKQLNTKSPSSHNKAPLASAQDSTSGGGAHRKHSANGSASIAAVPATAMTGSPEKARAAAGSKAPSNSTSTHPTSGSEPAKPAQSLNNKEASQQGAQPVAPQSQQPQSDNSKSKRQKYSLTDFDMGAIVGTGTFGRVRLVQHRPTQKYFSMKIFKKSDIIRLKQVDHVKSEIRILTFLEHPTIVNLYGHFQDEVRLYMVLEYVQGGELFTYLRRVGRLEEDNARFYAAQVALFFAYLHSKSIAYRDLKPENVLITKTGYLKITDFGFAKQVADRTWTLCGTPEYLAPEIIQSKGHGKPVDWWALGVLIFEMLAGYPPFYDENPFGIYQKILAGKIDFPKHFDVKVKDLVKKLLAADITRRIGCLKHGFEDVQKHKWFAKINWDELSAGQIPAHFVPSVKAEGDTSNFDEYPDEPDEAAPLSGSDKSLFADLDSF